MTLTEMCGHLAAINKATRSLRAAPGLTIRLTVSRPEAQLMMNGNSSRFYRDSREKTDATSLGVRVKRLFCSQLLLWESSRHWPANNMPLQ
jgi:hypothetical protein